MGKRYGRNQKRRHKNKILELKTERQYHWDVINQHQDEINRLKKYEGLRITGWNDSTGLSVEVNLDPVPVACRFMLSNEELHLGRSCPTDKIINYFIYNFEEFLKTEVPKILNDLKPLDGHKIFIRRK